MREAPHSAFSERAAIGTIILDQKNYHLVRRILSPDDFYTPRNRWIFDAIQAVSDKGDAVDAISIHAQMEAAGTVGLLGSVSYFAELSDDCIPSHAEQYARTVRELSIRRGIIAAGNKISLDGYNTRVDHQEFIESTRKAIVSACESAHSNTAVQVKDAIETAVTAAQMDTVPNGVVYTGIPSVDKFGGLYPGLLTVLGARPSMGKSGFALNVAANAALAGKKVLFVALEDIALMLHFRLLARFADVDSIKLRDRTLDFDDKMRVGNAKDVIGCLPLWIDDSGGKTATDIRGSAMAHSDRHGCDLVVIDHLAHVSRKGKEYDALTEAVSVIGEIPKEIDAPVLLLSQLNREVEKRAERAPQLSDLRGTGEIEQRARMIWFLDYPKAYKPDANPNELDFYCAKNTNGQIGRSKLHADFSKMHITDSKCGDLAPWAPSDRKNADY